MRNKALAVTTMVCGTVLVTAAMVARSGPIDPPIGPVSPSGPSLTDVFNAIGVASGGELVCDEPRIKDPGLTSEPATLIAMVALDSLGLPIQGSDVVGGIPDSVKVLGMTHSMDVPFEPSTGLPTGVRVHSPMRIVKTMDKASPKIAQACANNEIWPLVEFKMYKIDPGLGEFHYFTYTLTDARIVSIAPITAGSSQGMAAQMEEVMFTYRKIKWTWLADMVEFEDSWVPAGPGP